MRNKPVFLKIIHQDLRNPDHAFQRTPVMPQGFISEAKQFEMLNKEYEEDEYHLREQTNHDDEQPRTSKVRKLPPEQ